MNALSPDDQTKGRDPTTLFVFVFRGATTKVNLIGRESRASRSFLKGVVSTVTRPTGAPFPVPYLNKGTCLNEQCKIKWIENLREDPYVRLLWDGMHFTPWTRNHFHSARRRGPARKPNATDTRARRFPRHAGVEEQTSIERVPNTCRMVADPNLLTAPSRWFWSFSWIAAPPACHSVPSSLVEVEVEFDAPPDWEPSSASRRFRADSYLCTLRHRVRCHSTERMREGLGRSTTAGMIDEIGLFCDPYIHSL